MSNFYEQCFENAMYMAKGDYEKGLSFKGLLGFDVAVNQVTHATSNQTRVTNNMYNHIKKIAKTKEDLKYVELRGKFVRDSRKVSKTKRAKEKKQDTTMLVGGIALGLIALFSE